MTMPPVPENGLIQHRSAFGRRAGQFLTKIFKIFFIPV
jgi:hypothetical protein